MFQNPQIQSISKPTQTAKPSYLFYNQNRTTLLLFNSRI